MTRRRSTHNRSLRPFMLLGTALLACLGSVGVAVAAPLKVACIGEHTTHSDLFSANTETQPPGMQEYPRKLQDLMGSGYDVRNFGDCCASVISGYAASETHPYVSGTSYKNSVAFAPDIVVIGSWGRHDWGMSALTALKAFTIEKFQAGYDDLVSRYLALPNKPKIYASLPIPILDGNDGPDDGYKTSPAADAIKAVAAKYNLPVIDLYAAFLGQKALYINPPDKDSEGEHTSDAGSTKMAQLVAAALMSGGAVAPSNGGAANGGSGAGDNTGGSMGGLVASGGTGNGSGGAPDSGATSVTAGGGDNTGGGESAGNGAALGSGGAPGSGGALGSAGSVVSNATAGSSSNRASPGAAAAGNGCSCRVAGLRADQTWSALVSGLFLGLAFFGRKKRA